MKTGNLAGFVLLLMKGDNIIKRGDNPMSETVVSFNEIQNILKPVFGSQRVKIALNGDEAVISIEKTAKKRLKARGIFNECADRTLIAGEKGAWERAVVENYAANHNS